jgi:prevent-host-death family protein
MPISTFSSRELNQNVTRAKQAANYGPVFITDRGEPAYVLMSMSDYRRMTGERRSIASALAMPGVADIDFEPERVAIGLRPADLS